MLVGGVLRMVERVCGCCLIYLGWPWAQNILYLSGLAHTSREETQETIERVFF
jgi:hypothetical protein